MLLLIWNKFLIFLFILFFFVISRNSRTEVSFRKGVLKICSEFTGEHPCRRVISIKQQKNFIEIALRHGYSLVNLLHIFRTLLPKNTFLLLDFKGETFVQSLYKRSLVNIVLGKILFLCQFLINDFPQALSVVVECCLKIIFQVSNLKATRKLIWQTLTGCVTVLFFISVY